MINSLDKKEIRHYYIEKMNKYNIVYINSDILNLLVGKKILIYMPILKEMRFDKIIEYLMKNFEVYVPFSYKNKTMDFRLMNNSNLIYDELKIKSFDGKKVELSNIDCIILPGICFNKSGYRLGYGMGFYDRMLKNYKGRKIGVCYDDCFIDNEFQNEYDVKVDYVITNKMIYNIK